MMTITREQWQKMTPQQQFDYVTLLEDMVTNSETEGEPILLTAEEEETAEAKPKPWWELPHEIDWNGVS
jgi:hypothetical protein